MREVEVKFELEKELIYAMSPKGLCVITANSDSDIIFVISCKDNMRKTFYKEEITILEELRGKSAEYVIENHPEYFI